MRPRYQEYLKYLIIIIFKIKLFGFKTEQQVFISISLAKK